MFNLIAVVLGALCIVAGSIMYREFNLVAGAAVFVGIVVGGIIGIIERHLFHNRRGVLFIPYMVLLLIAIGVMYII